MGQRITDLEECRDRDRKEIEALKETVAEVLGANRQLRYDLEHSRKTPNDLENVAEKYKNLFQKKERELKELVEEHVQKVEDYRMKIDRLKRGLKTNTNWWKVVVLAVIGGVVGFIIGGPVGSFAAVHAGIGFAASGVIGSTVVGVAGSATGVVAGSAVGAVAGSSVGAVAGLAVGAVAGYADEKRKIRSSKNTKKSN